jgi:hypothetical protein
VLTNETIGDALERASATPPLFVPDYDQAVRRADKLRVRRLGMSLTAALAAIAGVAVAAVLTLGNDSGRGGFTVQPVPMATAATPSAAATVFATLAGVRVTWLPAGFAAEPASIDAKQSPSSVTATQDFTGEAGNSAAHRLSLSVIHGPSASPVKYPTGAGVSAEAVTVRGHQGQLFTAPGDGSPQHPNTLYVLQWTEKQGLVLSVAGSFGASLTDVQHMAAGLVVQHVDLTTPTSTDDEQVRAAFAQAYTGGASNSTILAAIENGRSLAPVLTEMESVNPQTVQSARIAVTNVSFTDADHATVTASLSYIFGGTPSTMTGSQTAVRVDGQWKVTESSYCSIISLTGVACPAN